MRLPVAGELWFNDKEGLARLILESGEDHFVWVQQGKLVRHNVLQGGPVLKMVLREEASAALADWRPEYETVYTCEPDARDSSFENWGMYGGHTTFSFLDRDAAVEYCRKANAHGRSLFVVEKRRKTIKMVEP